MNEATNPQIQNEAAPAGVPTPIESSSTLSEEQILSQTGGKVVNGDDWDQGDEIKAGWVNLEVGESVKGTLINKRVQKSNVQDYPDQWVYEIKKEDGVVIFIGFSIKKTFINNKLKNLQIGQIVMIKRFEDVPSQKFKEKDGSPKMAKSYDARLFGMDENYVMRDEESEDEIQVKDIPFN